MVEGLGFEVVGFQVFRVSDFRVSSPCINPSIHLLRRFRV